MRVHFARKIPKIYIWSFLTFSFAWFEWNISTLCQKYFRLGLLEMELLESFVWRFENCSQTRYKLKLDINWTAGGWEDCGRWASLDWGHWSLWLWQYMVEYDDIWLQIIWIFGKSKKEEQQKCFVLMSQFGGPLLSNIRVILDAYDGWGSQ